MKGKYEREKQNTGFKWVLIIAAVCLIAATAVAVMINAEDAPEETVPRNPQTTETTSVTEPTENTSVPTEETVPEETTTHSAVISGFPEFENGYIYTPYLTLYYPESFEDYLLLANSSREPYILEFYAALPDRAEQRIFDLYLGAETDGYLGDVETDAGEIPVSMTVYTFAPDDTWSKGEIDTILAMQEASNDLIGSLNLSNADVQENAPVLEEAPEENSIVNFLKFETPHCVLQYPAVWEEWLYVEQYETEYAHAVEFYYIPERHDAMLLFTMQFGGDEGEQLGVVSGAEGTMVPVNLLVNEPSEEGLRDDELEIMYAMQEAMNQLIERLPLQ